MQSAILVLVVLLFLSFIFNSKEALSIYSKNKYIDKSYLLVTKNGLFLYCAFSFFFFLLAFKNLTVGNDSIVYSDLFYSISNGSLKNDSRYEFGYIWLNKILSWIYPSSRILFIVSALFITYSYANFIKKHSYSIWLSTILFYLSECFDISANLLRQGIAIGILLYAFSELVKRKILFFIILVILAGLFHTSAYIFIILVIVPYISLTKKNICIFITILFGSFFISNILVQYLFNNVQIYADYANSEYALGGTRIASIINSLIILLILLFSLTQLAHIKKDNLTKISFWVVSIGELFLLISYSFNQIGRIAKLFTVFIIILLPNVLLYIKAKNPTKYLFYCFFWLLLWIMQYFIIIYFRPEWNGVYPYKFCFE